MRPIILSLALALFYNEWLRRQPSPLPSHSATTTSAVIPALVRFGQGPLCCLLHPDSWGSDGVEASAEGGRNLEGLGIVE